MAGSAIGTDQGRRDVSGFPVVALPVLPCAVVFPACAVGLSDVSGLIPVVAIPVLPYSHLAARRYAAIDRGGPREVRCVNKRTCSMLRK